MYQSLPVRQFAAYPGESAHPHAWDKLKLVFAPCLGLEGNRAYDLSPAHFHSGNIGVGTAYVASPIGKALDLTGSSNQFVQWVAASWGLPVKCGGDGSDICVDVYFKYGYIDNAARYTMIFRSDNPGIADTHIWGYALEVNQKTGTLRFHVWRGETGTGLIEKEEIYTCGITVSADTWHHVVVAFMPIALGPFGQSGFFMVDGIFDMFPSVTLLGVAGEFDVAYNTGRNARIGGAWTGWNAILSVALLRVWNRSLFLFDDSGGGNFFWPEAARMYVDPLAMFRRRRRVVGKAGTAAATRLISIGGTALRGSNVRVAG